MLRGSRVQLAALDDEQVLARYVQTDLSHSLREAAFFELVARYQHRLFSVCFRVLGSASDAEDAVQETFVRLARHAATFRGDARLSTWMYRVARNVCTDHVRYDARRPSTPVDDIVAATGDVEAEDQVAAHDQASALGRALNQLDDQSRTLLLMIAVDELTYDEAAEASGLAVGTVKSRVSRARVRLGELLAAADQPPARPSQPRTEAGRADSDQAAPRGPPS